MISVRTLVTPRLVLLIFALVITGMALASSPASVSAAACCGHSSTTTYYNNAAHQTVVGRCTLSCDDVLVCSGMQTAYSTTQQLACCPCGT
jgi:hypothetical protein